MNSEYKLIGFINMFNIIPDFVYPVFENNKRLYFQNGKNDIISEFVELNEEVINKVHYVEEYKIVTHSSKVVISLVSEPIYAFQVDNNNIACGSSQELCLFFEKYETPNSTLKEEIIDFCKETNRSLPFNATLFYYGTGHRKKAIARVRIYYGKGRIIINNRDIDDYFSLDSLKYIVKQPLIISNHLEEFDIICNVCGGGVAGQAGAIRLGISKALLKYNESLRPNLKEAGFLTRDSREKERKKYGLKGARKAPQHSKR